MMAAYIPLLVIAGCLRLAPPEPAMDDAPPPADRASDVRTALVKRGWPADKVGLSRQRPDLGAWQIFQAFPLGPDTGRSQVRVWCAPDGGVIVAGEAISKAQLRAVADQDFVELRKVAEVAALTAGSKRGLTGVLTGDPMETFPNPGPAEAARIEGPSGSRRLTFWARTADGGPIGLVAALDGDGAVTLTELPGQPR